MAVWWFRATCFHGLKYLLRQYKFFGMKAKDCYRFYTDIRKRKNYSRTYFHDKMQEKMNEKMRMDDELERMRR